MGLARNVSIFFVGKSTPTASRKTPDPHRSYIQGLSSLLSVAVFDLSLQSLLSSFVERKYLTRLYTIIALFDGTGSMVWALLINGSLKQGIHKGAAWIGLPFFIAAAGYSASMMGLFVVRGQRTL